MMKSKRFAQDGYVIEKISGCNELIQDSLNCLMNYASKGRNSRFIDFDTLGKLLVNIFTHDPEEYVGLLKAFANSPAIQGFATLPGVVSLARELGVKEPTLVTPPILHVVKEELILNRDKVFTPAHQDVISTKGSVGQVVFWIPLHKIDVTNYGIEAWPGSHLRGQLDTEQSVFGHTVASSLVPTYPPNYLSMESGEAVVFSQYLIHKTAISGSFRLAVSFRFNDALDPDWVKRKYFCAFDRVPNTAHYDDARDKAPKTSFEYFQQLNEI